MDALTSSTPMHFYDARRDEIACGARGAEHRSTRNPRFVTCPACVALAGARAGEAAARRRGAVQ